MLIILAILFTVIQDCENEIGSSNSNSAFDLPSDVERIYFKKGNLGCSVSYASYGFDRIPPSNPISLIPSVSVQSESIYSL